MDIGTESVFREALQSGEETTEQPGGPKRNQAGCGPFWQMPAWIDEQGQDTTHYHPDAVALCMYVRSPDLRGKVQREP